jgi:hypothetical protein
MGIELVPVSSNPAWKKIGKSEIVQQDNTPQSNSGLETLLVSAAVGVGGYALGKKHGRNEGYNQRAAEDEPLISQLNQVVIQQRYELLVKNIAISAKDSSINNLVAEFATEKTAHIVDKKKIAQLEQIVSDLTATVKAQQLQMSAKIFPKEGDENNLN